MRPRNSDTMALRSTTRWLLSALLLLPSSIPQFSLRDTDGIVHRQTEWTRSKAIVLFFMATDCPLSNGYVPEMNRIREAYAGRGIAFYAVQTDTTIPEKDVRKHAAEFDFKFPVLLDPQQQLVRFAGATATPEVAVLSAAGDVLYLGRIDNRVEDFNQRRLVVTEFNLRDALDSALARKPVVIPRTTPVGCGINLNKEKLP